MSTKWYFLSLVFIAYHPVSIGQGALDGYMKGKGNLDISPSFSFMSAQNFDGAAGQRHNIGYKGNLLSLFAAYGVTDRFDLVASVPYIFTSEQRGFQDGGFYAKYRVIKAETKGDGRISIIAGTGVSVPLSDYEPVAAGALGQRAVVVPGRIIAQWDTPWGPFINVTGGYNWRLDDYSLNDLNRIQAQRPGYNPPKPPSYFTYLLKVGLPTAHFYLDGWVEHQRTPTGSGVNFEPGVIDLAQAYGVTYTQVGGTIYFSENGKRGVFISGGKILAGRNVSRIFRFTVGIVFKL